MPRLLAALFLATWGMCFFGARPEVEWWLVLLLVAWVAEHVQAEGDAA